MNFSTSAAIFRWKPAAWLRVSGADAASFLQGQFTNELRNVVAGGCVYGLWLTLKGKVVADSFIVRASEGAGSAEAAGPVFWIGSYFSTAAVIRERLDGFIIADDVLIEDFTETDRAVSILGDGVQDLRKTDAMSGVLFPGRRERQGNVEWIYPATSTGDVERALAGLRELSGDEIERRRIEAGIAAVPTDIGGGDLPGEGALEDMAISYTKGCYLGQEVMARLKSMGQVRRRLLRVASAKGGAPVALPADLFNGDRKVGELRSTVDDGAGGWLGLALLSLIHAGPGASFSLSPNGATTVRLVGTP